MCMYMLGEGRSTKIVKETTELPCVHGVGTFLCVRVYIAWMCWNQCQLMSSQKTRMVEEPYRERSRY